MLATFGCGFGSLGVRALAATGPHFAPKAKRVLFIFLNGGASHVDTFDPKPMLQKMHGRPLPTANLKTERRTGELMKNSAGFFVLVFFFRSSRLFWMSRSNDATSDVWLPPRSIASE